MSTDSVQVVDKYNILSMITDTHAHYDDRAFDEDRDILLNSMADKNVGTIIHAAADPNGNKAGFDLCDRYPFFKTMIGLHPDDIAYLTDDFYKWMEEKADDERVVAVGEIGLDYYWMKNTPEVQKKGFFRQAELAAKKDLPICIHSRNALEDTVEILKEASAMGLGGVVHCYSYDVKTAEILLDLGFYFGIGGVLTFKKADELKETVRMLPLDRIVLETDAPYLSPEPFRGKRNDSSRISYVVEKMAEIKGIDPKEIIRATTENAGKVYPRLFA